MTWWTARDRFTLLTMLTKQVSHLITNLQMSLQKEGRKRSVIESLWIKANYRSWVHQCSWSGNPSFCHLKYAWIMTGLMKRCLGLLMAWVVLGGYDSELFHAWLTDHFLKHAVGPHPLLLLLDGHSSHNNPATIRLAKEQEVIVLCLPPHTTRVTISWRVCLGPWSETGLMCTTSSCNQVLI